MSDHLQGTQTWIDAIATPFDQAWRAFVCQGCTGQRPRIEDFLMGVTEPKRSQLLAELLRVEVEYRRKAGERPTAAEYEQRFREHGALVHDLFAGETELIDGVPPEAASAEVNTFRQFVGDYELLKEIGRGGQGIVYLALHKKGIVPQEVAVKLLLAGAVSSRDAAARFVEEVRKMVRIDDPHFVPYRESGNDRGQLYYVMRYMRGGSLAQFLKERHEPLGPLDAARLMIQIAEAVRYLHAQQPRIVHRDLKPHNILLDDAGRPYVADFGLAEVLDGKGGDVERGPCGTIPYIAPELFDGRFGEVGPPSDIYGLGVILFECLTGSVPFRGSWTEVRYQIVHHETPSPRARRPDIPPDLQRICLKCLKKPTESRYRSASELIEDLECFLQGLAPIHARPENLRERVVQWARREPALAWRLILVVACSAIMWAYCFRTFGLAGIFYPRIPPSTLEYLLPRWATRSAPMWNQAILGMWALESWAYQRLSHRNRWAKWTCQTWLATDIILLTILIAIDDALMSPLIVIYPILIGASGLWVQVRTVACATAIAMAAYILLVIDAYYVRRVGLAQAHRHFHFLAGLAILGIMTAYQAHRLKSAISYGGSRASAPCSRPTPRSTAGSNNWPCS
jgi:serine/threonine-protein kinase